MHLGRNMTSTVFVSEADCLRLDAVEFGDQFKQLPVEDCSEEAEDFRVQLKAGALRVTEFPFNIAFTDELSRRVASSRPLTLPLTSWIKLKGPPVCGIAQRSILGEARSNDNGEIFVVEMKRRRRRGSRRTLMIGNRIGHCPIASFSGPEISTTLLMQIAPRRTISVRYHC